LIHHSHKLFDLWLRAASSPPIRNRMKKQLILLHMCHILGSLREFGKLEATGPSRRCSLWAMGFPNIMDKCQCHIQTWKGAWEWEWEWQNKE
jgi:hypothetical protein